MEQVEVTIISQYLVNCHKLCCIFYLYGDYFLHWGVIVMYPWCSSSSSSLSISWYWIIWLQKDLTWKSQPWRTESKCVKIWLDRGEQTWRDFIHPLAKLSQCVVAKELAKKHNVYYFNSDIALEMYKDLNNYWEHK